MEDAMVMAMDPGETIGLAWGPVGWDARDGRPERIRSEQIALRDEKGRWDPDDVEVSAVNRVLMRVRSERVVVFVSEDFILSPGRTLTKSALVPVRIEAMVRFGLAHKWWGGVVLKPQTASQAKRTMTDQRLKDARVWRPGEPHACDAIRHLLLFYRRVKADPAIRKAVELWG